MATLMRANGTSELVQPKNGTDFQLDELYKLISTDIIQVVPAKDGRLIILDDEGKLKDEWHVNPSATDLADGLAPDDFIVGDVVVCNTEEFQ